MKHATALEIRNLIKTHNISHTSAAGLVHVSLRTWNNWISAEGSANHRVMPLAVWELLLLKLGDHPEFDLTEKEK